MKSSVVEFFLGKNVIAKIAIFLIFLGVVSFGQLAYLEWLGNTGRFILILCVGLLFFGIGYYFDYKKSEVFNNIFYGAGIFIVFVSLILARANYAIINFEMFAYLSLGLGIIVFGYFWNKRFVFLDSVLILFYMLIGLMAYEFFDGDLTTHVVINIIGRCFFAGFVIYMYFYKYLNRNTLVQFMYASIIFIIIICSVSNIFIQTHAGNELIGGLYILMYAFFGYVVLIRLVPRMGKSVKGMLSIMGIFLLGVVSLLFVYWISEMKLTSLHHSFMYLSYVVLLIPVYTYSYLKYNKRNKNFNTALLILIAILLVGYIFNAGDGNTHLYDLPILNYITGGIVIISYVIYQITYNKSQKIFVYLFIVIMVSRVLQFVIFEQMYLFEHYDLYLFSAIVGLVLVTLNVIFKKLYNNEDEVDNILIHMVCLIFLVPVFVTFTNELISTDLVYLITTFILVLIGYRWIFNIKLFSLKKYGNYVINALNIKILIVIFAVNLIYFDHNFLVFEDVIKFIVIFIVNVYVVLALYELYQYENPYIEKEHKFMFLYLVGVLIQSFFIHNYINVEFDKVVLSSYFMISSAVGILYGFKNHWTLTRRIGLGAIYYSLLKFFVYDFYTQDFTTFIRMITYLILGFTLLGIAALYSYLEKTYGNELLEGEGEVKEEVIISISDWK